MSNSFSKIRTSLQKLNQVDVGNAFKKLNEIDVGQAFQKLNSINLEDIRNVSFSGLSARVNYFALSVVGGLSIAGVGTYFLIVPQVQQLTESKALLVKYQSESEQLEMLRSQLDTMLQRQERLDKAFDVVKSFVSEDSVDLFTSKFFTETSRRSTVRLLDITPLTLADPTTCGIPEQVLPPPSDVSPNPEGAANPPSDPPPATSQPSDLAGASELTKSFKVNRFKLTLRGDYLNVSAYLRYLNDYRQFIVPLCFHSSAFEKMPPVSNSTKPPSTPPQPQYVGDVQAELIVDIPQVSRLGQVPPPELPSPSPPS